MNPENVHLDHDGVLELAGEVQRSGAKLVLGGRHGAQAQEELEGLLVTVAARAEKRKVIVCVITVFSSRNLCEEDPPMEQSLLHVPVARVHLLRILPDEAGERPKVALGPDEFAELSDGPASAFAAHA